MSTSSMVPINQPPFVENVPAEIWTEIIQNTRHVPTTSNIQAPREMSRRNIISASQICNRLRQIAIETPCLWTTILVDFNSSNPSYDLLLTRLWLKRSRTYPLSIALLNICEPDPGDGAKYECLVAVLSQIPRWKDAFLSWRALRTDFWSSMESRIDHAPLLESLIVDTKPDELLIGPGLLPSKLWVASPRLRELEVTLDVILDDDNGNFIPNGFTRWATSNHIPYMQLTHLRLYVPAHEIVSREELVSIFSSSPNLISCFVENVAIQDSSFECVDPILLRHLRHLYLDNAVDCRLDYDTSLSGMLDFITAPSLVTLTLGSELFSDLRAYENFIARSSCQLEELNRLSIRCSMTSEDLIWMKLSPSLRAVHFDDLIIDESFLKIWTEWDATESRYMLCPNLEQLSVTFGSLWRLRLTLATPLSPGLPQALLSRLQPPTGGLKTFSTLLIPSANNRDVPPDIHALCNEPYGLKIRFNDDMLTRGGICDLYADR